MYPLNPLEMLKIHNHPRHKIDYIASGLDTYLYLYIQNDGIFNGISCKNGNWMLDVKLNSEIKSYFERGQDLKKI